MAFKITEVPFLSSGLPGFLTPHAVQIHVTKHHQAYVDFANKNVPGTEFEGKDIETILKTATGPLFNNVAQHYNHSFFWDCLTANKTPIPVAVSAFLDKHFGTVDKFKADFVQKASTVFGSGWCYLTVNADKSVTINQYSNAANPIKDGGYPFLTVDTWEHAWYIDYENRKAEYFGKFWDSVNWAFVEQRLQGAPLA
jgi:Fe-Mn family superoxide dismutase